MPDRDWTSGGLFENERVLRLTLTQVRAHSTAETTLYC